jgi:hypothetical protein
VIKNKWMMCTESDTVPAVQCDICQGEVYEEEFVHLIDGYVICPDCFDEFVAAYFASDMVRGKELIGTNDDG